MRTLKKHLKNEIRKLTNEQGKYVGEIRNNHKKMENYEEKIRQLKVQNLICLKFI